MSSQRRRVLLRCILGAALSAASAGRLLAAEEPAGIDCRWAAGKIKIDGRADEEAWKQATVIDNFGLPWLRGDAARSVRTATRARLLWDQDALYFFADMDDGDLYADVKEHDGMLWTNDVFELFFKPAEDKPAYYEFQVNAANTTLDMLLPSRETGRYELCKSDGVFHLQTACHLRGSLNKWADHDEGWSVEGRIPWADFARTGGKPTAGDTWKCALCRYDYSVDFEGPEVSTCAPLTQAFFHRHEEYARLRFVGAAAQADPK